MNTNIKTKNQLNKGLASKPADSNKVRNQCDGCMAGHSIEVLRFSGSRAHIDPKTRKAYMICEAPKYQDKVSPCPKCNGNGWENPLFGTACPECYKYPNE